MNKNIILIHYLKRVLAKYLVYIELDSADYKKDNIIKLGVKKEHIEFVSKFLNYHSICTFKQLLDLTAVDYFYRKNRFDLMYTFLSVNNSVRVLLKSTVSMYEPVNSLCTLYNSSAWMEREVWDLFGIFFHNHYDLRRILTDYGFEGFPLRKDFPLTGFVEARYDDEKKMVIQEPIQISQEFRNFNFLNTWKK